MARSLAQLESLFGQIPSVKAKGANSKAVLDLMRRLQQEERAALASSSSSGVAMAGGALVGVFASVDSVEAGCRILCCQTAPHPTPLYPTQDGAFSAGGASRGPGGRRGGGARGGPPEIDALVMLDRDVDLISPMLTPLTYEGLIDELVGINNGIAKVEASIVHGPEDDDKKKKRGAAGGGAAAAGGKGASEKKVPMVLNGGDALYVDTRDLNIALVSRVLQGVAKRLRDEERKRTQLQSVDEIHDCESESGRGGGGGGGGGEEDVPDPLG